MFLRSFQLTESVTYLRCCFQIARLLKIFKWAELRWRISLTLPLQHILSKLLLMNWKAVIIIQFRLTKALMKSPKPIRWVYMFIIWLNLKIRHVRYLDSKFMCHATVNDLLTNFIGMINNVDDGSHIIQDRYIK